jgi:hypothetical protein
MRNAWLDWLLLGFVAVFCLGCVYVAGDSNPSRQAVQRLRVENATLIERAAEQHNLLKNLQGRVDYLEKRETAQTILNKTFIDFAERIKVHHKVDGWHVEPIPATNVPTVPPDRD